MSLEAKTQAVETYMKALNDADMSLIEALYSDNATVEDPYGTEAKEGIEAIKAFYTQAFDAGLKAELTGPIRVAGDSAAFPFNVLFAGNVMEIIDVFQFDGNDKVVSMKAYWSEANIKPA
ncbi:Steroid Delta-isomerase [BD1-7 clade bacterium]|uniref:Steroid Delta-isomerase n=1 Tax=BD1-7 clade bacterium TaxID=2029982 RepID=A0A5S9QHC7_9GAMM|nr:Steroid Delta-isomerase [BD1-7 clade bacterium]CAA0117065.1 Steroid Delta-isomerase [BD1-7 clade bacterium]